MITANTSFRRKQDYSMMNSNCSTVPRSSSRRPLVGIAVTVVITVITTVVITVVTVVPGNRRVLLSTLPGTVVLLVTVLTVVLYRKRDPSLFPGSIGYVPLVHNPTGLP